MLVFFFIVKSITINLRSIGFEPIIYTFYFFHRNKQYNLLNKNDNYIVTINVILLLILVTVISINYCYFNSFPINLNRDRVKLQKFKIGKIYHLYNYSIIIINFLILTFKPNLVLIKI